jgi:photosystem II stability/assembly factor-like uncharacterized protein
VPRITAVAAGVLAACSIACASALAAPVSTGHSGWSWGYPTPQGETLNGIAFDGATGYAVGEFGTVLSSTDAGATWTGLPSGTTVDLQYVQEVSPSVVVVAGGCTVSESTDSGATFTALPLNLNQSGCTNPVVGISFSSAQDGYIELHDGAVYYTADGGATLQARTPAPTGAGNASGIDFTSPTTGFAIDNDGDIEQTSDGANSWSSVESAPHDLNGITFATPSDAFAVGDSGELLGSTDGGASWTQLALKLTGGATALDLDQITCSSARSCLISTADGSKLIKTSDGGITGTVVTPSEQAINAVAYSTGSTVIGVGAGGTTVLSSDGGATFPTEAPTNLQGFQEESDFVLGGTRGDAFAGGQQGAIAATFDGGQSWSELRAPTSESIDDVAFPTASTGYVLNDLGSLLMTSDGGTSWRSFPTGHSPDAGLLAPSASTVVLVGPKGIERSSDAGTSFSEVSGHVTLGRKPGPLIASLMLNAERAHGAAIVVAGKSGLFTSANGGRTWRELPNPPVGTKLQDESIVNARSVWALGTDGRLFSTVDAGRHWTESPAVGGLARADSVSFSSREDGMLALGDASGGLTGTSFANVSVLSTTNGGRTWQPQEINGGQGASVLATPAVDYLLASTPGGANTPPAGFFETTDKGSSGRTSSLRISLAVQKLTAAKLRRGGDAVTVTGHLSPVTITNQNVVVSYRIPGGLWHVARAIVATGGAFSVTIHGISGTTDFVAQSLGNGVEGGAGTPMLQLTVTK